MDLFKMNYNLFSKLSKPLAERMRPKDLSFFIGQDNIIKNNSVLKNMIKNNRFSSMILYGPPGSGKTSLANIISSSTDNYFVKISAVTSGTKEIKEIIELAKKSMTDAGIEPHIVPVRGGTDGARLSFMGLPCPNLFAGGYNFHGRFELIPTKSIEKGIELVVKIAENNAK